MKNIIIALYCFSFVSCNHSNEYEQFVGKWNSLDKKSYLEIKGSKENISAKMFYQRDTGYFTLDISPIKFANGILIYTGHYKTQDTLRIDSLGNLKIGDDLILYKGGTQK